MYDSMFLAAFKVLIEILESLSTLYPISSIRARFYSSRPFQRAQKRPKRTRNEGDMKVSIFEIFNFHFGGGAARCPGQPCELTQVVGPTWGCGAWSKGSLTK